MCTSKHSNNSHTSTHTHPLKIQNIHVCVNMISDKHEPKNPNTVPAEPVNKDKAALLAPHPHPRPMSQRIFIAEPTTILISAYLEF